MYDDEDVRDGMPIEDEARDTQERFARQLAIEKHIVEEAEAQGKPLDDDDEGEPSKRKKLKRELRLQSLRRLEDAARTPRDFENIIVLWNKQDTNRERKERYHELMRSGDDIPLDYGASVDELYFPDTLSDVLEKQIRKGDFLDAIFYCPYEIHELVTEEYLSRILRALAETHKELLFLSAVRLFSVKRIAAIRGQTDRNIRKGRALMLQKIRKQMLPALQQKMDRQQDMTLEERTLLAGACESVDL
ncbi:MAG: hypothetical protein Q4B99_06975 [Clostridia bacterium]|nr:hypothetical protein [Clostridia bacterium]